MDGIEHINRRKMAALDNGGIFKLHKLPSKPMTAADAAQSTTSSAFPELLGFYKTHTRLPQQTVVWFS